jgi:CO dehydrogenase maturation factor
MKLAITGKGGVGKSTIAAVLIRLLARSDQQVLALDADPDANLAAALGLSPEAQKKIIPLSRQIELIEERTGAKIKQYGQIFKLNPEVSDIADRFASRCDPNIALMVLGAVDRGGSGCACPENVFIRSLVTDLILYRNQTLIMDMEAGVEHLGRATATGVDIMLIVLEPGQRSVDSARRINRMAQDIGINDIRLVANKIVDDNDRRFLENAFDDLPLIGTIPYSDQIRQADRKSINLLDGADKDLIQPFEFILKRLRSTS